MKTLTKNNIQLKGHSAYCLTKGYTFMELMIVLGIASIMMAVGAPSVMSTINHNAQINAVNVFKSGIGAARASALTRKRPVVMESMDAGGDWSTGFFIKFGTIANDSEMDTEFEADNKIRIKETSGEEFLSFDQLGRVTPAGSVFEVCNQSIGKAVIIDVNIFGNAVVRRNGDDLLYEECVKA